MKGSNLKNQRQLQLGSQPGPHTVLRAGEVIKWCLGAQAGWADAPLLHLRVPNVSWEGGNEGQDLESD